MLTVAADLTTAAGIDEVFARLFAEFGGIDILVNSLGLARGAGITDTTDAEWQEAFDSTLLPAHPREPSRGPVDARARRRRRS